MDSDLKQYLDENFARIDQKFAALDPKFARIDGRFAKVDAKFAGTGDKFAEIEARLINRIEKFETKLLNAFRGIPD